VACMTDHSTRDKILHDLSEGQMHGVRGTPTFFVNGHAVIGFTSVSRFSLLVDEMLANDLYE
jgi:protein-disulfide isomerase